MRFPAIYFLLPLAHHHSRSSRMPLPGGFPVIGGAVVKATCHICEQNVCGIIYRAPNNIVCFVTHFEVGII